MGAIPAKLWELGDALEAIIGEILEAEGEVTPELEARLDALQGTFDSKAESVALAARVEKANAERARVEADRLAGMVRRHERAEASLKAYLQRQLERVGRTHIKTDRIAIRLQANSRPSIRWPFDVRLAPEGFTRTVTEIDGNACYEAWKAKDLPEGFEVVRGNHLRLT
jgi:VIT1/CCC1 family predicted Fe2+/Mn2+ transporter